MSAIEETDLPAITAIEGRRSVRAFLPDPVPRAVIERILDIAARAPSGTNMQPWKAYALAGEEKERLSRALLAARDAGPPGGAEYRYYPPEFFEPYLSRRRKVGWDMYGLLDIARGDKERMHAQHGRNFVFFDAPVGIMFTIDRRLEIGSWLDYGMFLQNLLIAARAFGLEACPQAAFAPHQAVVREALAIPEAEIVVCGVAIGREDKSAPVNRLVTEREPAAAFTDFRGFG
ncbi:MAG: nitroreductase [Salinarimonadaceae bacterium]|nr:MAG: nitroreductase [Salinarimonadaceae bacterium]